MEPPGYDYKQVTLSRCYFRMGTVQVLCKGCGNLNLVYEKHPHYDVGSLACIECNRYWEIKGVIARRCQFNFKDVWKATVPLCWTPSVMGFNQLIFLYKGVLVINPDFVLNPALNQLDFSYTVENNPDSPLIVIDLFDTPKYDHDSSIKITSPPYPPPKKHNNNDSRQPNNDSRLAVQRKLSVGIGYLKQLTQKATEGEISEEEFEIKSNSLLERMFELYEVSGTTLSFDTYDKEQIELLKDLPGWEEEVLFLETLKPDLQKLHSLFTAELDEIIKYHYKPLITEQIESWYNYGWANPEDIKETLSAELKISDFELDTKPKTTKEAMLKKIKDKLNKTLIQKLMEEEMHQLKKAL